MITITVSEDGRKSMSDGGGECHAAQQVEWVKMYGNRTASITTVRMTKSEAFALLADIGYQLVDDGFIAGWSVQFPDPLEV